MDEKLEEVLGMAGPEVREIAAAARKYILGLYPDLQEKSVPGYRSINFGDGSEMKDHFLALILHTKHVNLQFFDGVDLDDPEELLEGTGKRMRHIRLSDTEAIRSGAVTALIHAAARNHLEKQR